MDWLLLTGAGLLAGLMNATAGGGTFVTLPALVAAGLPSVAANASSTIALYPGGAASSWVYRHGLTEICGIPLRPVLLSTLGGGLIGSVLLLVTPGSVFDRVLPWLLLLATLMLAYGRRLGPALRARVRAGPRTVLSMQFVLGIYGGYFGGAVGLMMLAAWAMLDGADIKALNPARMILVSAANTVAVLCFSLSGLVWWPETLLVSAGALIGGYGGAYVGRALPGWFISTSTLMFAAAMTAYFFWRAYAHPGVH